MLCVTGLPLIFEEEIHHLPGAEPELAAPPSGASPANLDSLIEKARAQYPGQVPLFLGWYSAEPIVYVNLGPTPDTAPAGMRTALFDAYTGAQVSSEERGVGKEWG